MQEVTEHFIAGWIGGVFGLVVGHPLDTVKVRQQTFGTNLSVAISRTFRHEGLRGFYKGMMFPILSVGASNAVFFGAYGNVLKLLEKADNAPHNFSYVDKDSVARVYIAGCSAGAAQAVFTCPFELIKTVLQANTEGKGSWKRTHYDVPYVGSIDALKGIYRTRGITGLFRGLTIMLVRDVPTSGLYTLTYELLIHFSSQWDAPLLLKQMLAGGTAGIVSWLPVVPVDVLKSQIQSDNPENPANRSIKEYFDKNYRVGGYRIFFRGLPAIIIRAFPVNAAIFTGYEGGLMMIRQNNVK